MNLSKQKLLFLTETLPKMKFSQVIRLAMADGADLQGYLNIRKAGQRLLFGAVVDEEAEKGLIDEGFSEEYRKEEGRHKSKEQRDIEKFKYPEDSTSTISALIDGIIKQIKSKYEPDSRARLDKALGDNPEKSKIMQDLKSNFVKPGPADDKSFHKKVKKDIDSYLKSKGLSESLETPADNWVSLMRMAAGHLNEAILSTVMSVVHSKMKSNLEKESIAGTQHAQEAASFIVAELLTGRSLFQSLDRKDKPLGAGMILADIKSIGNNLAITRFQEFKLEEKRSPKKVDLDTPVDSGEGSGGSLHETIADPSSEDSPLDKSEQVEIMKWLEEAKEEALESYRLDGAKSEEQFKNIVYAIKQAQDSDNDWNWGSDKWFSLDRKGWIERGIENSVQWRTDIKNPLETTIRKKIDELMIKKSKDKNWANALMSSKLSYQLLIRAISNEKIILASKVSAVGPSGREGNVRVFEKDKPQFSHEFYWKIEDEKIHIAEVEDVDEDHMNEAYQTAFEAIKEEALLNNIESQYIDKPREIN